MFINHVKLVCLAFGVRSDIEADDDLNENKINNEKVILEFD